MYSDEYGYGIEEIKKSENSGISDSKDSATTAEVPVPAEDDLSRLTKRALDIVIKSGHFGLRDSINLQKTSRSLKNSVDKTLFFHTTVLCWMLANTRTAQLDKDTVVKVVKRLPACYSAIINEGIEGLKPYLREFFELMLDNLVSHPKIVCLLVQIAKIISLKPSDFQELGQEVLTLFEFLTRPIKNEEKENEDKILNCIVELKKKGYTKKQCENLEASIRETFKFLRHDGNLGEGFIYKNLSGAHLTGANFEGANLCGANLKKANLIGASLPGANLEGANLVGATLKGADLTGANLSSANLSTAIISGELSSGAKANLEKANFSGANLHEVDLFELILDETNLTGANLSSANLSGAFLKDSNLSGAKLCFAIATGVKFVGVNLREADLSHAFLTRSCFERVNLEKANLFRAHGCAKFEETILRGANFEGAELEEAEFFTPNLKVEDFIDDIKESIKLNPTGTLPLLLNILKEERDEIGSEYIAQLKKLCRECLTSALEKMSSVRNLFALFSQVSVKGNVFCTEIYPDVLPLIAKAYIYGNLSCEPELDYLEIDFRKKLIEEINKQKVPQSFHNDGWNSLLAEIEKAELKSSQSFNSQSHIKQM